MTASIQKYASCSNQCFILALIYIDRLIQRNNFLLTELNVHRVVITAILLAAKFFDDAYYNNAYYAKVGGVLVSEMNGLEVDFLFRINFSLHVTPEVYEQYRAELASQSAATTTTPMIPPPVIVPDFYSTQAPPQTPIVQPTFAADMMQTEATGATTHNEEDLATASHITPSPPPEAGRLPIEHQSLYACAQQPSMMMGTTTTTADVEDMVMIHHQQESDKLATGAPQSSFAPLQRAKSLPTQAIATPSFHRIGKDGYHSAPMIMPPSTCPNLPYQQNEPSYVVVDHRLFPIQQETLVHYHHGGFSSASGGPTSAATSRFAPHEETVGRMLASGLRA